MNEVLSKLDSQEILAICGMIVGVIAILGSFGVVLACVLAAIRRRAQLDEMEATLKMEMIQRGMTADDIKKVLEGKLGTTRSAAINEAIVRFAALRAPAQPPAAQPLGHAPRA